MICEICQCDPCDCEDVMGYNNEFWGLGTEGNEWNGEIHPLAYEGDWSFHEYGQQVAQGNQAQNGILLESVSGDFQGEGDSTSDSDSPGS